MALQRLHTKVIVIRLQICSESKVIRFSALHYEVRSFYKKIDFWCAFWYNYVDGKLIRQTAGFGTIDFIYGALGGLMEGAITPVREIAEKTGKPLSKVLTKVIRKTAKEIVPSLLGGAISFYNQMQIADRTNKLKRQNKKKRKSKKK